MDVISYIATALEKLYDLHQHYIGKTLVNMESDTAKYRLKIPRYCHFDQTNINIQIMFIALSLTYH